MKKLILMTVVAGAFSSVSYAEGFTPKFYGGLEVGYAQNEDQTTDLASAMVDILGGSTVATQDKYLTEFRIFGGYKVTENIDVEFGYMQSSDNKLGVTGTTGASLGNSAYTANFTSVVSGYDYGVLLRPNISSGLNEYFFKIGGHRYDNKISGDFKIATTTLPYDDTTKGSGTLYGVGYDAKLGDDMAARLSLIHYAKISGESDNKATIFSVAITKAF